MELQLLRSYFPNGTNGELWYGGQLICHTIELPWLNNQRNISCIPEGVYKLQKRFVEKFQWHLGLYKVPNRQLILIHPANNAKLQLRGCIAPVTKLESPGIGSFSREAVKKINDLVFPILDKGKEVQLKISVKSLNS
ncbi:DUF5675 family protein [Cytophaga aurantiaca]|uniref:DUF5675 family protein n=1 Tax=Cytophaga aurantiaca TaxID=29530 RepID=UPI000366CDEE|nr:DUF5675 family protein [Cytophaga aurantiaca]